MYACEIPSKQLVPKSENKYLGAIDYLYYKMALKDMELEEFIKQNFFLSGFCLINGTWNQYSGDQQFLKMR